jgi:hypothetical protein
MSAKAVKNSEKWDWKENPIRYAPLLGFYLCEKCWNCEHTWGKKVGQAPDLYHCCGGDCQCPCRDMENRKRIKFTAEGQTEIPMENALRIEANS